MKHLKLIIINACIMAGFIYLPQRAAAQDSLKKDSVKTLKEVSVTASKQIIKRKADRIIYDLQADPESRGRSLLDMMRKVPYLSVDANDNVLLKGNPSFKVLINGKPSPMFNNNLTAILKSMPASTIQSIEVITVPPSKYDAEGLAGIINIITIKKIDNGYNGTLNANETFPASGPGGGGSLTLKDGKLGVSAYGGINHDEQPSTSYTNNQRITGANPGVLQQDGTSSAHHTNDYFGGTISYEIDSLNLVSADINAWGYHWNSSSTLASALTNAGILLQGYDLDNNYKGSSDGIDASINYQLGFKHNKGQLLTFSYEYSNNNRNNTGNINVADTVNFPTPDYRQTDHEWSSEQTAQVDYVAPVKNLNIEAGIKGIFRDNKSNFDYSSLSPGGQYVLNPALSDDYNNTQDVFGAYNSYGLNLKTWNFQGGVRVEETLINADFVSTNTPVKQRYFNVIPTIAINKTFADRSSLSFGFFQRIRRPSINRLNPFVDRSNPSFETTGNPNLRPDLMNEINVGYSLNKKVSLNIGLSYDFMKNLDLQEASYNSATNVTLYSYQNLGKASGLTTNINVSYPITKNYNMSLNSNVLFLSIDGTYNGVVYPSTHTLIFIQYSNGYNFNNGWRANIDLNVNGKTPTSLQGNRNGYTGESVSVNKEIIKNKLNFSAGIKNPFAKYRYDKVYTYGPDFFQTATTQQYFRSVNFSLNYNFGGLKDGIKKSKKGIRNDDTGGGGL